MHRLPLLFASIISILSMFSQTTDVKNWRPTEKDSMELAFNLFEKKNFIEALPLFENIYNSHNEETFIKFCYGVCCLERDDKYTEALTLITQVYKKNNRIENIDFYMAKANHLNNDFDEALKIISSNNAKRRNNLSEDITSDLAQLKQHCINARVLTASPTNAQIINVGNIINTPGNECNPLTSADLSSMIFNRSGDKDVLNVEGIYLSIEANKNWLKPAIINKGYGSDKAIALSPDGLTLFLHHKDDFGNNDIYSSEFDYFEWSVPLKLKGAINSLSWEGNCSVSADGKYMYFSSDRPGGLGGKDIYRASLLPDKSWGNIMNMGENINTSVDEDSPFIHADGSTFFFSSKGRNSMGGYDIFQSKKSGSDSTYTEALNLGVPINSPGDELNYILSADGNAGYYASGKKGGEGLKDIYKITNGYVGEKPTAYVVKGIITKAINVLYSDITIDLVTKENKYLGEIKVNSVTGTYMTVLPTDNNYKLIYKYKSFEYKTIEINTSHLQEPPEQIVDVFFDIKPELAKTQGAKDSVNIALQKFEQASVSDEKVKQFSQKYGTIIGEGLEFMVQVGAYKYPKKYDFKKLKKTGKITEINVGDGITRFVIGTPFNTLRKAFDFNKQVIKAGQKDAFVVIVYKGKRVSLEELETMGIFIIK